VLTDLAYQRGLLDGRLRLGITNQQPGPDGRPAGPPQPNLLLVYGRGQVSVKLTPWLIGTAVIDIRPFDGGDLFGAKTAKPLPGWAKDIDCRSWAEAFLKWIVSHPAVTCAIPATSKVAHLRENVRALSGPLPDAALRRRIAEDYAKL
jgi:hypothetical protein